MLRTDTRCNLFVLPVMNWGRGKPRGLPSVRNFLTRPTLRSPLAKLRSGIVSSRVLRTLINGRFRLLQDEHGCRPPLLGGLGLLILSGVECGEYTEREEKMHVVCSASREGEERRWIISKLKGRALGWRERTSKRVSNSR